MKRPLTHLRASAAATSKARGAALTVPKPFRPPYPASAVDRFIAPFLQQTPQVLRAFKALARAVRRGLPASEVRAVEARQLVETWAHPDHWQAADKILGAGRTS